MRLSVRCVLWLVLVVAIPMSAHGQSTARAPSDETFFETRIRPLLAEACWSCHGAEKQRGGLRLDSRAAILQGGDLGPSVVIEDPAKSMLLRVLRHDGELKMPPKGKLAPPQIADLEEWVRRGIPWPAMVPPAIGGGRPRSATEIAADHWAFQPVRPVAPPRMRPQDPSILHPIDAFLQVKLDAKGLKVAPPADRRTLIRRVTFDLTGLPPTPDEIDAFLADESPDAWRKLVDRLLQSTAYGERWGRHWLDVARYADSNGMDENLAHANAWRYRDWVIRSFNEDMPFDRFVRMQVAGDLLAGTDGITPTDGVTATGFLMIGPKMLAEDDPVKMRMDIIDEQIDTIGQAFLGMTFGCARCHDHKFDPISTRDYYALAGIFHSTKTMDSFKVVARWQERPLAEPAMIAAQQQYESRIAKVQADIREWEEKGKSAALMESRPKIAAYLQAADELRKNRTAIPPASRMSANMPPAGTIVVEAENFVRGNVLKDRENYGKAIGVLVNAGELPNRTEYEIDVPQGGRFRFEVRFAAAESRPVMLSVDDRSVGEIAKDTTGGWLPEHQAWRVGPAFALKPGKHVLRFTRQGPVPHIDRFALVPLPVNEPLPLDESTLATDHGLNLVFLRQTVAYLERVGAVPTGEAELNRIAQANDGPFALPKPLDDVLPSSHLAMIRMERTKLAELQASKPNLPTTMAVSDEAPGNIKVHIRGNHLTLGAEVPRGFPNVFRLANAPKVDPASSGRKEFADWLTRSDHPLTARVIVNRVWLWHFGDGLVRTPDNFGLLGDTPIHRELLDWLTSEFIRGGWSIKQLHRLILSSAAYQRSSAFDAEAAVRDPDNRLNWRWNRQRLSAEAVRDSLLMLGGTLERRSGGSLLTTNNRAYVTSTANRDYDGYDSPRRAVYLPIIRSALYTPFQALDFPDPSVPAGRRAVTTVPPQALLMMNSSLVADATQRMAERLLARQDLDDRGRIALAYSMAFGRSSTPIETDRTIDFLANYEKSVTVPNGRTQAWQAFCRVLVSSNQFLYVE